MSSTSKANPAKQLTFRYRNWRGQTAIRVVTPESIWYGESEWHSGDQWFLRAIDDAKGEIRDFALLDMEFLGTGDLKITEES
jgi:predicted DNA-binding transcriptional regulator YafY